ncbi:unnamed protein product [Symbiodinium natans]|uniref:EF-hand domain-containing protein n=1 Tax=Symbiodinium natans TaxID=878477 RepID=A0A812UZZ6_9DINO|nr:unnamed protein product [Symbiodinium natans]
MDEQGQSHGLFAIPETDDPIKHREWATRLWIRMDRDRSGTITREELMCDEFQEILKAVIAPKRGESNAAYGRSEINVPQAVDFCMRKAAQNATGELSFDEFSSFLRVLRKAGASSRKADLIFALFDLDQSGFLDKDEFLEVYRYFLGHRPTSEKFEEEWANLDVKVQGHVSQKQYNRWLRASTNLVFKPYAPPADDDVYDRAPKFSKKDADGLLRLTQQKRSQWRPLWNDRWNCQDSCLLNKALMPRQKHMFSRVQSETELRRFYSRHPRWDSHYEKLDMPEPARPQTKLTADIPPLLPERHVRNGRMRNPQTGRQEVWNDFWQTPKSAHLTQKHTPGSIHLRCIGAPPDHLVKGRDDDEDPLM